MKRGRDRGVTDQDTKASVMVYNTIFICIHIHVKWVLVYMGKLCIYFVYMHKVCIQKDIQRQLCSTLSLYVTQLAQSSVSITCLPKLQNFPLSKKIIKPVQIILKTTRDLKLVPLCHWFLSMPLCTTSDRLLPYLTSDTRQGGWHSVSFPPLLVTMTQEIPDKAYFLQLNVS